jgi:hypothetical protein
MLEDYELPEALAHGREHDPAARCGCNGRALGRRDVDPGMEAVPARAEAVADRSRDRL